MITVSKYVRDVNTSGEEFGRMQIWQDANGQHKRLKGKNLS